MNHLIRAKLYPPRLSPDLVPRQRLVEQLNAGLTRKFTLVSAPAGFGKTTLLCEWVQQAPCPVAWLTLDDNDNVLHSFLTYFIAAIERVYPHSCAESQSLLRASSLPAMKVLVPILANDLELLPGEMILVLDDFHTLHQLSIHNLLDTLIAYLPAFFHLVLGTRISPLISLVTLRARAELCEIRHQALRFTQAEMHAFFAQEGEITLDEGTLRELEERTEGWPVGLRLLLLSTKGQEDLRATAARFMIGDSDIMSYLTEQVLGKLSPALVHFLLCTAIVERFSRSLYSVLSPERSSEANVDELLAQCLRENLFVVAQGEGWYRYHPLFRELLLHNQARQMGVEGVAEQNRRASQWLEQNGAIGDAIRHALVAGDERLAIAILDRHRIEAMNHGKWPTLERWLGLFPRALVEAHPILGMTQAWIFDANQVGDRQKAAMQRVAQQLGNENHEGNDPWRLDPALRRMLLGELNALLSDASFEDGEFETMICQAQLALELLPRHVSFARAIGYLFLSVGYQYTGNFAQAEATLQSALAEESFHDNTFRSWIEIPRFVFDFLALKLDAAKRTALQIKVRAQASGVLENLCWGNYFLGIVAYVENRLDDARQHFEEVIAHRHAARFTPAVDTFLCLALIDQAQGRPDAALGVAAEITDTLHKLGAEEKVPLVWSLSAHLALLQGNLGEAMRWAGQAELSAKYVPDAWSQKVPITRLRVLLAEGSASSLAEAAKVLPALQQSARMTGARLHLTQMLVLQAVLHDQLGDREAALAALEEALAHAQPSRAVRLFADIGSESSRRLSALLCAVDEKSQTHAFARHLLGMLPVTLPVTLPAPNLPATAVAASPTPAGQGWVEALTQREVEILALIAQGMSNKQIARQLHISEKTAENHTVNIFQKLNVHKRTQAVRRAMEIGLLPR